jgi:hypothetical protein
MARFLFETWRISSRGYGFAVGVRFARRRHFPGFIVGCSGVRQLSLLLGNMMA